ncbi:MAG TPA: SMP-30/gluconolactonase/LRE family protein [Polyangiales bacterium]|nr:SMP-30/gluconolactonase/LRE family protein [Polyangiales bacterium]
MIKKVAIWAGAALVVLLLYLLLWPVPIDPIVWEPPPVPALEGDFAANRVLRDMEVVPTPEGHGPEDVAVDAEGRIYVGVEEGKILRYASDGADPEVFADTGGRPLGLDFDNDGNLIVADASLGLISVDPSGAIEVLCTKAGEHALGFADDVDVDSQNVAWFSDASFKWTQHEVMHEALESAPNGRLLKHDLESGECTVVLTGLHFANGVAVAPDDTYVLVNETMRYRTKRVYVRGPRQGEVEVFIDNLPGFPDGISTGTDGIFWLALYAPRNELLDSAGPKPWLREIIFRIPTALQPKPRRHPFVLGLDENGEVVYNLQDEQGATFSKSTSAEQAGDWLYVGSLTEPAWGRIRVSELPRR